ncbi:MAG: LPXTG cell wall anchor domain-containing protein [Bacteroidetes bacterium]|nr:MAG: LPXTG cell wall anchor domain-containing protein [Bacteroidota bacterium]
MKIILIILTLLTAVGIWGQTESSLDKKHIFIGEHVILKYRVQLKLEEQKKIAFPVSEGTIKCVLRQDLGNVNESNDAELEVIGAFRDTLVTKNGKSYWEGRYTLTAWDTGYFVIPPVNIPFRDSVYQFDPQLLYVTGPEIEQGKDEIYGLREKFVEVDLSQEPWWKRNWYYLLSALVLLAGVFWFLKRRKKKELKPEVKIMTLRERSLLAIDALEKESLWSKGKLKEHYVELSFLLRSYLSEQYQINLLEKTSKETGLLLRQLNLSEDTCRTIQVILDYSDMAKFANSRPGEGEIYRNLQQVRQIVVETSPIELNYAE